MDLSRLLAAIVIRAVALTAVTLALLQYMNIPGDDDGLGTGLVAFLILFVGAGIWGLVDGVRRGFVATVLVWLVAVVLFGLAVTLISNPINGNPVADELSSSATFFAILVGLPAFVGAALGAITHRVRPRDAAPVSDPAT